MSNLAYAILHIPSGNYITINSETVLCKDFAAAHKVIDIMTGEISYYWGLPRTDFKMGKESVLDFYFSPGVEEFDIIAVPVDVLNQKAVEHLLELPDGCYYAIQN